MKATPEAAPEPHAPALPEVILTQPRYGPHVWAKSAEAYYLPSTGRSCVMVGRMDWQQSIAFCFNTLLATALDARDHGFADMTGVERHPTHFAMIHSDVWAEQGWLDVLVDEMTENQLTAVSAVIPIKEGGKAGADGRPCYATSTAIGRIEHPWETPRRYINTADRDSLPTTFTLDDLEHDAGDELLINTGLLLLDLRDPVWTSFENSMEPDPNGWSLTSRITRQANGRRKVQMRPEDWEMSRFLRRNGRRYGATWAVECLHFGEWAWSNR